MQNINQQKLAEIASGLTVETTGTEHAVCVGTFKDRFGRPCSMHIQVKPKAQTQVVHDAFNCINKEV